MSRRFSLLIALCFAGVSRLFAADTVPEVTVSGLTSAPVVDGVISEGEWEGASVIDEPFVQNQPEYGVPSAFRTRVRIGQTSTSIFFAFEAFDDAMSRVSAAVTDRDGDIGDDDSVGVMIDPFGDDRTAYLFRTNVIATQQDGRIADNGRTVDLRWDESWRSAAHRYDDRWTVEIEIPFAVLKHPAESGRTWGLNLIRSVPRRLETALWSGPSESTWRVSRFGELTGLEPPEREGKSWEFIPYALAVAEVDGETDLEVGADARWRPSSRFGIDLTVNPDFALVEADVETINLSRFELFIPEKRPFFLEGAEQFEQRIRQFYSRRIGEINWGTKASGKVGKSDFSAIYASEDVTLDESSEEAGFGVFRLQQSVGQGSNVGFLVANRSFEGEDTGSIGLDTTLFFTEQIGLTAQVLRVHGPTSDGGYAWFIRPAWDTSTSHFHLRYTNYDEGIREDFNTVGFLNDDDRKEIDTELNHEFWIDRGPVEKIDAEIKYNRYTSQEDVLRSWEAGVEASVVFRNGFEAGVEATEELEVFEKEFRNDLVEVYAGWDGRDGRKAFVSVGSGANFNSDLKLFGGHIEWPFGERLRLVYDVTWLELDPDPEGETTWIHVFEARYAFSPDLFIKLFLQTNTSINKENVQLLGVWRFKPPFGSLQLAYQRGTSEIGEESDQGDTVFTKLAWVF